MTLPASFQQAPARGRWSGYGFAALSVGLSTAVCFAVFPYIELTNLVMIYLLGTLAVAARGRRGPAAFASVSSVLCFDFFFVPPRFTFNVSDAQYLLTFGVMFIAAMIISHLTIRLQEEAETAREQERHSVWLMEKAKKSELEAESERLRSSLLSSVSHDFRTPLAGILGSAGALLEKEEFRKNPGTRDLLENIEGEARRLSRLVQNLLETTRLESGGIHVQKELYPLEEIVGSVLERMDAPLKGREVSLSFPENLPAVPVDGVLLEQVFTNLLENAVRHTSEKSQIEISASVDGPAVQVSVIDHGAGLKPEELERVFDKFYHDPASPGAGLGLAICRAVIQAHGGKIWAENRKGGGAIFKFTLPLKSE